MASSATLSPSYIRQAYIVLALARPFDRRLPRQAIEITVAIDPIQRMPDNETLISSVGLRLPIEVTVLPARAQTHFQRQVFNRQVPQSVTFVPRDSGPHLVRVREVGHNRWHGELVVEVE